MFTGIVRECGTVAGESRSGRLRSLRIRTEALAGSLIPGASVAVDGVCLTLVKEEAGVLHFDAVEETLSKSTLSRLKTRQLVHLEPALRLGDPVDGHLVYGHVDGVGRILGRKELPGRFDLSVRAPEGLGRYIVEGGSICLSGASLTSFDVKGDEFTVTLIPETLKRTKLGGLETGEELNLEVDMLAKWAEKLLAGAGENTEEKLKRWGY